MSRVGENIKKARLELGMTQKQLGKKLGVAESYINEIELGRKVANEAFITKLSKVFNKDINDVTMYAEEVEEVKEQERRPQTVVKAKPVPQEISDVWSNALSSVLKNVPVYKYDLGKIISVKALPLVGNKVEGYSQDKVLYLEIEDDDMIGFRIGKGDLAFGHFVSEVENNAICLVEYNNARAVRQIKRLDNTKVLLISNRGSIKAETVGIKEIKVLAKLDRVEIKL